MYLLYKINIYNLEFNFINKTSHNYIYMYICISKIIYNLEKKIKKDNL